MTTPSLLAALIIPIPFFHLWLHALLPLWRRSPLLLYLFGLALWVASFEFIPKLEAISPVLFQPSVTASRIGLALIIVGFLFAAWSMITIGPTRFFVWAVLRPLAVPARRITSGPFSFLPHPAYIGYLAVAVGNLMRSGMVYLAGVLVLLLWLTPVVIWLEEHELGERLESKVV